MAMKVECDRGGRGVAMMSGVWQWAHDDCGIENKA